MYRVKQCRYCRSTMPSNGSVCPTCRKKQGIKTSFIIAGIIAGAIQLIIVAMVVAALSIPSENNTSTVNNSNGTTRSVKPTKEPIQFTKATVEEIMKAYSENEVKADRTYKDVHLEITAEVSDIGKDILDDTYIMFTTEEDYFTGVQCFFSRKEEIDKVAELSKGDTVTIQGIGNGALGNVFIKKCVIK